jgi:hypothetical protein
MEKIRVRYKHPGSATLHVTGIYTENCIWHEAVYLKTVSED